MYSSFLFFAFWWPLGRVRPHLLGGWFVCIWIRDGTSLLFVTSEWKDKKREMFQLRFSPLRFSLSAEESSTEALMSLWIFSVLPVSLPVQSGLVIMKPKNIGGFNKRLSWICSTCLLASLLNSHLCWMLGSSSCKGDLKKRLFFFVLFCLVFFVASLHNSVCLRLLTLPVVLVSAVISVSMECAGSTRKPEPPRVTRS